ncbi:MAG TPA: hypothetical protein VMV77_01315 [Bacteroidales bacterium]|nr:hypothetical protein [Bacteroidales bacterium]
MGKLKKQKEDLVKWEKELTEINSRIPVLKGNIAESQKELSALYKREEVLKERIRLGFLVFPEVTDHAIVRYLERVHNIDIGSVKDQILSPDVLTQIEILGPNGKFVNKDLHVIMRNNKVLTIYDPTDGHSGNNQQTSL